MPIRPGRILEGHRDGERDADAEHPDGGAAAPSNGTATDGADYTAVAATLLSHPDPSAATTLGPHTAAALRTVDNE